MMKIDWGPPPPLPDKIVGVATDAPQEPFTPEPVDSPPGSEQAAFVAMLTRAGFPIAGTPDGSGTEVSIGRGGESAPPQLRVGYGADASFQFDSSGTLIRVELLGD